MLQLCTWVGLHANLMSNEPPSEHSKAGVNAQPRPRKERKERICVLQKLRTWVGLHATLMNLREPPTEHSQAAMQGKMLMA